jgi:hypothetical protein
MIELTSVRHGPRLSEAVRSAQIQVAIGPDLAP